MVFIAGMGQQITVDVARKKTYILNMTVLKLDVHYT